MQVNERLSFRTHVKEWLKPLGFEEIYSINHPTDKKDEVHFSKSGIRVICIFDSNMKYSYWKVYADCFIPYTREVLSVQTGRYGFDDTGSLNLAYNYVNKARTKLERKSLYQRIKNLLKQVK